MHAQVKSGLRNRLASLKTLADRIKTWSYNSYVKYHAQRRKEGISSHSTYKKLNIMREIVPEVTNKAQHMVYEQWQDVERFLATSRKGPYVCTESFTMQWGLPCRHKLLLLYDAVKPLSRTDFSRHWWLHRDQVNLSPPY